MKYIEENNQEKHEVGVTYLERYKNGFIEREYDNNNHIIYLKYPNSSPQYFQYDKFKNNTWYKDSYHEQWFYHNENGLQIFRKTSWGFRGEWKDYDELNNGIEITNKSKYWKKYKYNEDTNSIDYSNSKGVDKTYYYDDKAVLIRVEDRTIKDTYKSNAQEILNKLVTHFLGEGYYIADPVGGNQANEIIYDEITSKYSGYTPKKTSKKRIKLFRK